MIWFLSLLTLCFLTGIAVLFVLDQPGSEDFGTVSLAPARAFRPVGRGIMSLRPMGAAGGEQCLDDF